MASWGEFERGSELASRGRELLYRNGTADALLTTIRGDGLPRTHPVNIGIVDGRLYVFAQAASAKARDLAADGRYALHAHQDPSVPHEFQVRGRATEAIDGPARQRAAADWAFTVDSTYRLFELGVEHALFGERADPDEWPPRYSSWRPTAGAAR